MQLHKIYINKQHGFTLIETVITLALFAIITTVALTIDTDNYARHSLKDEQTELISTLYRARSQAMNTICLGIACTGDLSYGLHIEQNQYVLFRGSVYNPLDPNNQITILPDTIHAHGISDVIFIEFSGDTYATPSTSSTIVLVADEGHVSTTTISRDGQISWTD